MFVLRSKITIGTFTFRGVNEVNIEKSIFELADTAIIKIPTSARLRNNTGELMQSQPVQQIFNVGDEVTIMLGYGEENKLKQEFKGYVKRINFTNPVEIECEGQSWLLRNRKNIVKYWEKTTLKEVLELVVKDTDIKLHPAIPDLPLRKLKLDNASGTQVIEYLKELLKGTLTACFFDDMLYVGLAYMDIAKTTVKYRLGWNTIDAGDLKFRRAEETEVNIQFQVRADNGQKATIESGKKGGIVRKETISAVTDQKHLQEIAEAKLKQESFDGYEGSITTFLIPFCQHGYRAEVDDKRYPERGGNYFVTSVKTSFGQGGARRTVEIGIQLS
jgi:hypothetical protein